ncbi:MAG: HD domain-containing protein [Clostridia bacterium]|nr:HD domain-containing protein [Clostridia bacterium]
MRIPGDIINQIPEHVLLAIDLLESRGYEAYVVGGAVRDILIGALPFDFDITTSARVEETIKVFEGFKTIPTGIAHGTVTVLIDGHQIEITTFRLDGDYLDHRRPDKVTFTDDLSRDLLRRDFTVNALAYSPSKGLIDVTGGIGDIDKKIIRCVGDPEQRFKEDALRIMRALRFSAKLGFDIDPDTKAAAIQRCGDLRFVSAERINAELSKLLVSENIDRMRDIFLGDTRDVIFEIIPELKKCVDVPQINQFHCYDVYTHTVAAMLSTRSDLLLRMTLLLHDIGKPDCLRFDSKGNTHFTGHADISACIAETVLNRLRYPKRFIADVTDLVRYHEFFRDPLVTSGYYRKAAGKLIRLAGTEHASMLPEVMSADVHGKKGDYIALLESSLHKLKDEIEDIVISGKAVTGPSSLAVSGRDLKAAGIPKGETMGRILSRLAVMASEFDIENEKDVLIDKALQLYREGI